MNEDKIDRWGDITGHDQLQAEYTGDMELTQKHYQDLSLERLRVRLEAAGIERDVS